MKNIDDFTNSLEINYPCVWQYKIIGADAETLRDAVETVVNKENFMLAKSKRSTKGKFVSFNLSVEVQNENHRLEIFDRLKAISAIRMIL